MVRPVVLVSIAILLGLPLLAYVKHRRGTVPRWKRFLVAAATLNVLGVTVIELTDATAIAAYPTAAFVLDVGALVVVLASIVLFGWSFRVKSQSDGDPSAS